MEDFDPNNPGEGGSNEETDSTPLPPGRYMLCAKYLMADKKGNGKHRTMHEVIAGPGKGRTPWWAIDVGTHPRARKKLADYCRAVGNMERFNPGDMKQLVARFKFQPFVATLGDDSWTNGKGELVKQNGVQTFHSPEEWTDDERQLIAAWKAERAMGSAGDSMGGELPPDDQDGDPGPGDAVPF